MVQLDENKSQLEGVEGEVRGLRYNIYIDTLPERQNGDGASQ